MGIIVYDDHIIGAEERFELYFPTLLRSNDVQLIEIISESVTVIIQDDEGNQNTAPKWNIP